MFDFRRNSIFVWDAASQSTKLLDMLKLFRGRGSLGLLLATPMCTNRYLVLINTIVFCRQNQNLVINHKLHSKLYLTTSCCSYLRGYSCAELWL